MRKPNTLIQNVDTNVAELLEFRLFSDFSVSATPGKFLINIAKVLLVTPCPKLNPGQAARGSVLGTCLIRNTVVPILDLRQAMGFASAPQIGEVRRDLIVLAFMGAKYAILVDEVTRIHYVSWSEIIPTESSAQMGIVGVAQVFQESLSLLDLEKFVIEAFNLKIESVEDSVLLLENRRLAIIDDSPVVREMLKATLKADSNHIDTYPSATVFLEQQKKNFLDYDDLILDIEMPGMDGLTLSASLRRDAKYKETRIHVYSSLDQPNLRKLATEAGANSYTVKQDIKDLIAEIGTHLPVRLRLSPNSTA